MASKASSLYASPCAEAAKVSLECQLQHPKDRDKCADAIEFYKECKRQWMEQLRRDKKEKYRQQWE